MRKRQIVFELYTRNLIVEHICIVSFPFLPFFLSVAQVVRSNVKVANVYQSMNFVIHVSDARMAVMNHHISVILNVCRAYFKRSGHKHDREAASIVHFNVKMDDAVRQPSFARDATDAVITVMSNIAVYAVSV